MTEGQMQETIRSLYSGIFDPDAWQVSLRSLCQASDSTHATLVIRDTVNDRFSVARVFNHVPEAQVAYEQHYEKLDPAREFVPTMSVGHWYIDARDLGEQAMKRHPFYGEFFREFGLGSLMACLIERQPHYEVFLSLQRPPGHELYRAEDAQSLAWAVPHVRHAMALRDRALEVTTLTHVSEQLLERMTFGVIVMSANGKVLVHNRIGEPWIRRLFPAGGTTPGAGKSPQWSVLRPVAELVKTVCRPLTSVPARGTLAVGRDGRHAQIVVLALPAAHQLVAGSAEPAALVAIHEQGGAPPLLSTVLRELYALTPAESRLASVLTTGIGLPEACERLSIRRETSRTQLKSIFTKTATGTQAQLAHLMTQLGASLNAQPDA